MEPTRTILLKFEMRHDMRWLDVEITARCPPIDFSWSKIGGEGAEIHPSGQYNNVMVSGRSAGNQSYVSPAFLRMFPVPAAPIMPPRAVTSSKPTDHKTEAL